MSIYPRVDLLKVSFCMRRNGVDTREYKRSIYRLCVQCGQHMRLWNRCPIQIPGNSAGSKGGCKTKVQPEQRMLSTASQAEGTVSIKIGNWGNLGVPFTVGLVIPFISQTISLSEGENRNFDMRSDKTTSNTTQTAVSNH